MKNKNVQPTLPDDVIMEEIPVKSLTRFKSVSKHWLSTISTHKFVKTHLKFSSSHLQALISYDMYIDQGSCLLSFDECDNVKEMVELDYNFSLYFPDHPPGGGVESFVIGSCNGLVCLYDFSLWFYIWNPATKQCHHVSCPDFDHDISDYIPGMGFGYVSSIDDYRIGLLVEDVDDDDLWYVYVYSLRARKWLTMPSLDQSNENVDFRVGSRYFEGVVVDDTLYWSPQLPSSHNEKGCYSHIAGLNLVNGEMKKLPLKKLINGYDVEVRISGLKGCLSMCCYKFVNGNLFNCVTDVWMLKHQNDWNSWEKVMCFDFGSSDLLWLYENGNCLRKTMINGLCHVALNQSKGVGIWSGSFLENSLFDGWGYVESLISPFGTNFSDENQD